MGFFSSIKNILGGKNASNAQEGDGEKVTPQADSPAGNAQVEPQSLSAAKTGQAVSAESQGQTENTAQNTHTDQSTADLALLAQLRSAPPRLSAWLEILLSGVDKSGSLLWQRLTLLFKALEAPETEATKFISGFQKWLDNMGYEELGEFRSELQFRLALALELEDEEDERNRLLLKLGEGLSKTRQQLSRGLGVLFQSNRAMDEAFWEELEEALILGDVGYEAAMELTKRLKNRAAKAGVAESSALRGLMQEELTDIFKFPKRITAINPPEVILMVGVNGAGKTTTIAKLAHRAIAQGKKVLVAAGDTFRAAAVEQLEEWAKRTGADFYRKNTGADPAAVAYEATEKAVREGYDLLIIDTAGRLQTKTNLMEELEKIRRVISKLHQGAPHRCILVLDANTGQNALSQAKEFKLSSGVDEIILTKLDGTAKGGIAVAIAMQFALPITFIGLGEKMEDLRPFDGAAYAAAILGSEE